jgi:hypothetical protein
MRRPGGYAQIVSSQRSKVFFDRLRCEEIGEGTFEVDTFTCVHCNSVVHVPARQDDEYFCRNCMARICPPCADHPCLPWLKKLEIAERRDRALRSYEV